MYYLIYYSQQPPEIGSPISQMRKLRLQEIQWLPQITGLRNDTEGAGQTRRGHRLTDNASLSMSDVLRKGKACLNPPSNLVKSNTIYHSQVHDCF